MDRIFKLSNINQSAYHIIRNKYNVGLITGVFDIVHYGHIDLFRFAKRFVDKLLIGIESDQTAKRTKTTQRPIFQQQTRANVLSEMRSIDYVCLFDIDIDYKRDAPEKVNQVYQEITQKIEPKTLITNKLTDRFWLNKKRRADRLGINFIGQQSIVFMGSSISSTTKINDKLSKMDM